MPVSTIALFINLKIVRQRMIELIGRLELILCDEMENDGCSWWGAAANVPQDGQTE